MQAIRRETIMFILLSVIVICVTIMLWSAKYLQPYHKPVETKLQEAEQDGIDMPTNFDDIIAEIYGRLEDE